MYFMQQVLLKTITGNILSFVYQYFFGIELFFKQYVIKKIYHVDLFFNFSLKIFASQWIWFWKIMFFVLFAYSSSKKQTVASAHHANTAVFDWWNHWCFIVKFFSVKEHVCLDWYTRYSFWIFLYSHIKYYFNRFTRVLPTFVLFLFWFQLENTDTIFKVTQQRNAVHGVWLQSLLKFRQEIRYQQLVYPREKILKCWYQLDTIKYIH